MSNRKLGRGLQSLLSEPAMAAPLSDQQVEQILQLETGRIAPNPYQPRTAGTAEALEELKASIAENGILQPVVVRQAAGGYQLVAGERRWRAAMALGLQRVPAVVRDADDAKMLELALVENIQREDLNPVERAVAYRRFQHEFGLTQEQAAARLGIDRSQLANHVRLLELPEEVQELIAAGGVSLGHGKVLLRLKDPRQQAALAQRISERGVSVRQTEAVVEAMRRPSANGADEGGDESAGEAAQTAPAKDPNVRQIEDDLRRRLGTKVLIQQGKKAHTGRLVIEYYSLDDFDRILQAIR